MTELDTLTAQDNRLVKLTPVEETALKIVRMRAESLRCSDNGKIETTMINALVYMVKYLRNRKGLSDEQITTLSSQDLNCIPEIIFADNNWSKVLLLGCIPIFGWIYAGKYIAFKKRVNFLRSLDDNVFDKKRIDVAIRRSHPSPGYM